MFEVGHDRIGVVRPKPYGNKHGRAKINHAIKVLNSKSMQMPLVLIGAKDKRRFTIMCREGLTQKYTPNKIARLIKIGNLTYLTKTFYRKTSRIVKRSKVETTENGNVYVKKEKDYEEKVKILNKVFEAYEESIAQDKEEGWDKNVYDENNGTFTW